MQSAVVKCVLCPQTTGAFKQLNHSGTTWVHAACALWTDNVEIRSSETMSNIVLAKIPMEAWEQVPSSRCSYRAHCAQTCYLCQDGNDATMGACMTCANPECDKAFHVTCALNWCLADVALDRFDTDAVGLQMFCHDHNGTFGALQACLLYIN